jgi:hypothetical protein
LAAALKQKPFKIIADAMELGRFMTVHQTIAFDLAARIARKYGIHARKIV